MNIQKIISIALMTVVVCNISAQKMELGKVTVAELEEKSHAIDPSAPAAILFRKGEVRFEFSQADGFVMKTEVKTKIKIYKKEGYEWANYSIPLYIYGGSSEKVYVSDAATYNLEAGKIVKTKMKSDGEFDEKVNKYWARKKIALPNVKEGSIVEYSFVITSPNYGKLFDWDFQSTVPVNYSEFKTYIPEYYIYNPNQKGFVFPKVTIEKNSKTVNYSYRDENVPGGGVIHSTSQEKLNYEETQTTYVAQNLPAMKQEVFVNNINNYTSSISHELSIIKYPRAPIKTFSTDWETVVKKIYDYDDFGLELKKTGYFEADITTLIKGLTARDEIIAAIFNYVKTNVKWDGLNDYYCHDGVKQAYKTKTGNVAEVNLMLTAMLRFAGIDANPVLVSTRSNGIAIFPNRTAFNYVISAVETGNDLMLLDATEKYTVPNVLPLRDLNWFGRLIRKDGTSAEVNLMPKTANKESYSLNYKINKDATVDGKIRKQFNEHTALDFRQNKMAVAKDSYLEELENKSNSIEISEYVRDNDLDLSKSIIETYSFKDTRDVEVLNDKMYVNPLLFLTVKENIFKLDKREYPIDFGFPFQEKYLINIEIPDGYTVESLPKATNMVTGDDIGSFKYMIGATGNKIQVNVIFEISNAIVGADYYDVLKDFYQKMVDKQTEKIVLKKI